MSEIPPPPFVNELPDELREPQGAVRPALPEARLALASRHDMALGRVLELERAGVDAGEFYQLGAAELAARTGWRARLFDDAARAQELRMAKRELKFVERGGIQFLYHSDEVYPARLRECPDAPAGIYVLGQPATLNLPHNVAIVGTRHATVYGRDFTRTLVRELANALGPENLCICSGLAYGVDVAAHSAALEAGVPTAAVMATPMNTIYPADHRAVAMRIASGGGALVTEYPSWQATHKGNFLARNRIIAGLADVTIVVESDLRGGAMTTARLAAEYGRAAMALPGRVTDKYSRGCNELIATGRAWAVRGAADVLALLHWTATHAPGLQQEMVFELPAEQRELLRLINEHPEADVNELCALSGRPYPQVSAQLVELELDEYVEGIPGGRYVLTAKGSAL